MIDSIIYGNRQEENCGFEGMDIRASHGGEVKRNFNQINSNKTCNNNVRFSKHHHTQVDKSYEFNLGEMKEENGFGEFNQGVESAKDNNFNNFNDRDDEKE